MVVFAQLPSASVRDATYFGIWFIAATAGSCWSAYGQTLAKAS
jgi:hypothetical protein